MKHLHIVSVAATAVLALVSTATLAQRQSWHYKSAVKDPVSGQYSKTDFRHATVSIEEKDGKAMFRMVAPGRGDPCINQSDLPAEVQRDDQITTITVLPPMVGCEPFRYLIRNDGSGGVRQIRRNERWVNDGFDHGLTPKN